MNTESIEELFSAHDGLLNDLGLSENITVLENEYKWLNLLIDLRGKEMADDHSILRPLAGELVAFQGGRGPYARLVERFDLSPAERILLLTALQPHYMPITISERVSGKRKNAGVLPSEFGYYKDPYSSNYYPTLQTVLCICGGKNPLEWRKFEQQIIHRSKLFREQIITLRDPDHRERVGDRLNKLIDLAPEYVDYILHGQEPRPDFGRAFPASWISTNLSWDQLVLNKLTMAEISDVMDWVEHRPAVLSASRNTINKSYPCLFYGPPGTGKSFTAKLIGKQYGKNVFRIDLSMIVSKYIGETEKNLAQLFDRAEGKDWILFFDEADALFGKRTGITDSKDKWANLEMSYLLQRMEEHEGLCILATNLKQNLDPALSRRFQALIYFPFPKPEERALIWQKSLPPGFEFPSNISFEKLADYELSGAGIANVIKACAVKAVKRKDYQLSFSDISRFIKLEYAKDSRTASRVKQF